MVFVNSHHWSSQKKQLLKSCRALIVASLTALMQDTKDVHTMIYCNINVEDVLIHVLNILGSYVNAVLIPTHYVNAFNKNKYIMASIIKIQVVCYKNGKKTFV